MVGRAAAEAMRSRAPIVPFARFSSARRAGSPSSRAPRSAGPSRVLPLSRTPPYGIWSARHVGTSFTRTPPKSSSRAARSARGRSRVKIAAWSPYRVSLARRNASSTSAYVCTAITGPNTSCEQTFMSGCVFVKTVGSRTPSGAVPPARTLAPPATASSIHDFDPVRVRVTEISADTSVASSRGSPTTSASTRGISSSRNASAIDSCRYTRWVEMHDCPAWLNPATATLAAAVADVAVGFDDEGSVVPELEAHLLARRAAADSPADFGRSGEGDERDVRVLDDRVADRAPATGDHVEVAGRETALVEQQLGERDGGQRRLRRGLQHHRAAGRDRGGDLVGDEVQREVERADRADHADGNAQGEAELSLADVGCVERHDVAREATRLGGGERERRDRAPSLDPSGLDRLGGFLGDDPRELLVSLVEQAQRRGRGSRRRAHGASGPARCTASRRGHGAVDLGASQRGTRSISWPS